VTGNVECAEYQLLGVVAFFCLLFCMAVHDAVSAPACPTARITSVTAREWNWSWRTRQSTQGKSSYGKVTAT
jgi:hypothetical protein